MGNLFLPNLFVLGAAKSGTTTLYSYLNDMPEICMSRPKEPFFFECEFSKGLNFYKKKYFSHWRGENIIGEARHRNLYLPFVPKRIHKINPSAKLIIILRNPTERAFSHWYHWFTRGKENLDFQKAIVQDVERIRRGLVLETSGERDKYCNNLDNDGKGIYRTYVDSGYYLSQIERYLKFFNMNHLKIILLDDLIKNWKGVLKSLRLFLGLSITYVDKIEEKKLNTAVISSGYFINESSRTWLNEHYSQHNKPLSKFLGRDLSFWA